MADLDQRLSDVEHRLTIVRDEVDALQNAAAETKKSWLRQTPSLASVLALLVSLGTAVYSAIERQRQDVEQKHNALRGLVSQLLDLSTESQNRLASADSAKLSAQEREFIGAMINNKRMVLTEAADNLVRQIPNAVTSAEYNFLANDKLVNGGAAKAEEYLEKAVDVSGDDVAKMNALRNLGFFYAQRGPLKDMEKARKKFQQAVEVLGGEPRDDATAYALGFTWEMWGTAEYMNSFPKDGSQKVERARKYYSDMSSNNSTRYWALFFLEQRERSLTAPSPSSAAFPPPPTGIAPFASPPTQPAPSARPER